MATGTLSVVTTSGTTINDGATTVCQGLGFSSGTRQHTRITYSADSMAVGRCQPGQALTSCTEGGNGWGNLEYRQGWCKAGTNIGVTVTCTDAPTDAPTDAQTYASTSTAGSMQAACGGDKDTLMFGGASEHCSSGTVGTTLDRWDYPTKASCREACVSQSTCTHYMIGASERWGKPGDCLLYSECPALTSEQAYITAVHQSRPISLLRAQEQQAVVQQMLTALCEQQMAQLPLLALHLCLKSCSMATGTLSVVTTSGTTTMVLPLYVRHSG